MVKNKKKYFEVISLKRILSYFLAITLLLPGFINYAVLMNGSVDVVNRQTNLQAQADGGIEIVARRPYIRRGEMGVLAIKVTPGSNCRIIASYKMNGRDYSSVRNLVSGKDGNVLCTWKVDEKTDTGTYNIEITCGPSKVVTTYTVQ